MGLKGNSDKAENFFKTHTHTALQEVTAERFVLSRLSVHCGSVAPVLICRYSLLWEALMIVGEHPKVRDR